MPFRMFRAYNDSKKTLGGRSQLQRKPVPRYYQWLARASKMGKRLEGFLPRPGLTPEVDGNCSGGCENRQGCVTECLKVEKLHKTQDSRGLRIESSEKSNRRRARRSHLPNFWPCRASRQWELPVAGSHNHRTVAVPLTCCHPNSCANETDQ